MASQKIWLPNQAPQSCGISDGLPPLLRQALAVALRASCVSVAMTDVLPQELSANSGWQASMTATRPQGSGPERSDGEHQQKRDEEREDPERFRERDADEHGRDLAAGGRRVAQRARQVVADNVAHTDGGPAHAGTCQACTDVSTHLNDIAFHFDFSLRWNWHWSVGRQAGEPAACLCQGRVARLSDADAARRADTRRSGS